MNHNKHIFWITFFVIFSVEFFWLSASSTKHKFLMDEKQSISSSVNLSVGEILSGNTGEGNPSPLFFLAVKSLGWTNPRIVSIASSSVLVGLIFASLEEAIPFIYSGLSGFVFWVAWFFAINLTQALSEYGWMARHYAMWMLSSWLLTMYAIKRNGIAFTIMGYISALITPFGFLQWLLTGFAVNMRLRLVHLPLIAYGAFLFAVAPHYGFRWLGIWHFPLLILHHAGFWLLVPISTLVLLVKDKTAIRVLVSQAVLCVAIAFGFYLRRNDALKFYVTERYFIFLLPTLLYILIHLTGEYINELRSGDRALQKAE